MPTRELRSAVVVLLAIISGLTVRPSRGAEEERKGAAQKLPGRVDEVLWWLPEDTQTLAVCQGPFTIGGLESAIYSPVPMPEYGPPNGEQPRPKKAPEPPKAPASPLEKQLRAVTLGLLSGSGGVVPWKLLNGRRIALAVEGSRRFRSPSQFGMMPYQGAHLILFQDDLGPAGDSFMAAVRKAASKVERIAGHDVAIFAPDNDPDRALFFVARPKPEVLIWATDGEYLKSVLKRMVRRAKVRALPADLPEWADLNPAATFWAIRHYDRKDAANDPSSPLAGKRMEANVLDDKAIGLLIAYEAQDRRLNIRYYSTNKDALEVVSEMWGMLGQDGLEAEIGPERPGAVHLIVPLGAGTRHEFPPWSALLSILQALGHSVSF